MKQLYLYLFFLFLFSSCAKDTVQLTDLTKKIINIYDELYSRKKENIGEIIIDTYEKLGISYIDIYTNSKNIEVCGEDFRGKTHYLGYSIYIFGVENEMFYKSKYLTNIVCNDTDEMICYDPIIWYIGLNKDSSLFEMDPTNPDDTVSIHRIEQLFETFRKNKGRL